MVGIDKTRFFKEELEKMLHLGLIPTHHINEVEIMAKYLADNNIFKYEKREFLDDCPVEIKEILADIRFKYWQSKRSNS